MDQLSPATTGAVDHYSFASSFASQEERTRKPMEVEMHVSAVGYMLTDSVQLNVAHRTSMLRALPEPCVLLRYRRVPTNRVLRHSAAGLDDLRRSTLDVSDCSVCH